jgi:hypothetical protein
MQVASMQKIREQREELGQFLTPAPLADFMASMFGELPETVRLLDAGAGAGALTSCIPSGSKPATSTPALCAVTRFQAGGLREISRWWSEARAKPPVCR